MKESHGFTEKKAVDEGLREYHDLEVVDDEPSKSLQEIFDFQVNSLQLTKDKQYSEAEKRIIGTQLGRCVTEPRQILQIPEKEIRTIALETFKDQLLDRYRTAGILRAELLHEIEADPEVTTDELFKKAQDTMGQRGQPQAFFEPYLKHFLKSFVVNRERIKQILTRGSSVRDLLKWLPEVTTVDDLDVDNLVTVEADPFSIHLGFKDTDTYSKYTKQPNTGGLAYGHLPITVSNDSLTPVQVREHEKMHKEYEMLLNETPKRSVAVSAAHTKNEMLAYFKDGTPPDQIPDIIFNTGAQKDPEFVASDSNALAGVGENLLYAHHFADLSGDELSAYKEIVSKAADAMEKISLLEYSEDRPLYTTDEIIGMLAHEPLERWPNIVRRLLAVGDNFENAD